MSPSRSYSEARGTKQAAKRPICHSSNPATELGLGSDFGPRYPNHGRGTFGRASRKALSTKNRSVLQLPELESGVGAGFRKHGPILTLLAATEQVCSEGSGALTATGVQWREESRGAGSRETLSSRL